MRNEWIRFGAFVVGVGLMIAQGAQAKVIVIHKDHPCKKIRVACENANYFRGAHERDGKGLFKDCMKPIMAGKSVEGVTVSADDVAACKAKRAENKGGDEGDGGAQH
ncbi:MAG: hypothetical protein ACXWP5_11415 [Bdellovibrionota bacterium]